jgi:hypothetical protein
MSKNPESELNKQDSFYDVKCTEILDYTVKGVVTHHYERVPVFTPDDLFYQSVEREYDWPRAIVSFHAKVNTDLVVGAIYTDGINDFVAVSINEIRNKNTDVTAFQIPKQLAPVAFVYFD